MEFTKFVLLMLGFLATDILIITVVGRIELHSEKKLMEFAKFVLLIIGFCVFVLATGIMIIAVVGCMYTLLTLVLQLQ